MVEGTGGAEGKDTASSMHCEDYVCRSGDLGATVHTPVRGRGESHALVDEPDTKTVSSGASLSILAFPEEIQQLDALSQN